MSLSNSQYDSIIGEYDRKRARKEREYHDRIDLVNEKVEGYKELGEQIASLGVSSAKALLSGERKSLEDVNQKIDELSQKRKDLLIKAGYPEDYLTIRYDCPDCHDTGYINGTKCHCLKQAIISVLYSQSNISKLLKSENFDTLSYDYYEGEDLNRFRAAASAARSFVENFDKDYQNLLFCGTVGTGKSFLSCCIAGELLDRGHSVIYFSAVELFEVLSSAMFNNKNANEAYKTRSDLYECDLLIIDDLGTELTNSAVVTELFSLINERHLSHRSTVISTNLSLDGLRDRYDDRVFSRIAERYEMYRIQGPDIRMLKRSGLAKSRKE